ncbi:MAG: DUF5662 family protein [Bacilli bacterium]|nr:DUF5662 family protein [Bacilli bacterium]
MSYRPFKHIGTIIKHRHRVIRNGRHLGIWFHCWFHDLSKYSHVEFHNSAINYVGTSSPVFEQRKHNGYVSTICLHHTGRNKHHWEYWADFFKGNIVMKTMPYKYALEYVADMLSASKTYDPKGFKGDSALRYFQARKDHYYATTATKEFIEWCLTQYSESKWKNLKKKITKKKYLEITSRLPDTEVLDTLHVTEKIAISSKEA